MTPDDLAAEMARHPSSQPARVHAVPARLSILTDDGPDLAALAGHLAFIAEHLSVCDRHPDPFHDPDVAAVVHVVALVGTDDRVSAEAADVLVHGCLHDLTRAHTPEAAAVVLAEVAGWISTLAEHEHDDEVHRLTEPPEVIA